MSGRETISDPTRLIPEGPRRLRKALCFFLLHVNHRHFIPWPLNEAALRYLLCRVTAYGSQGKQTWPRPFLVPCISTRMSFGYWLTRKTTAGCMHAEKSHIPRHTGWLIPLCISVMFTSMSDSASPLRQTWLGHPPGPPLPLLAWLTCPEGTSSPACCA